MSAKSDDRIDIDLPDATWSDATTPVTQDGSSAVVDVTTPASVADRMTLAAIRSAITSRADEAAKHLKTLRAERDRLNQRIKEALADEQEARRFAAALKPRAVKKTK